MGHRKMMESQWLFFDLGSTLLDEATSLLDRFDRAAVLARGFGAEVTGDDLWNWAEEAYTAFESSPFKCALRRTGLSEKCQNAVYEGASYLNAGEFLYPGVLDLLRHLAPRYRLGIIANQPMGLVPRLRGHGILSFFGQILGSGDVGLEKPDPAIFRGAMREAPSCTPGQMAMIGDRIDNDIRPARLLGWQTIRVHQGIARRQIPREPAEQPDHEIDSIASLAEIL